MALRCDERAQLVHLTGWACRIVGDMRSCRAGQQKLINALVRRAVCL